ncbi:unnamed protein product [Adineta steineri]|uniref:Uncharacterized protein n=1 Tax=Adineta steineri TaxID=433720 RepID=A0A815SZV8_9BILA|nr:unnamed protein product [Adineta steineri]CAF1495478.1 unnamed protein product [Adineta steineri]CAF3783189.1 unnamed protein product [Adineta steineri]CAF4039476.1 unnamed protein product [Adineta steineri]
MTNELRVKRASVDEIERHWAQTSLNKNHASVNSSKVLNTIADGKRYIQGLKRILKIDGVEGINEFIDTLCFNIEFDGASATEFKQIEFKAFGKKGTATYLLVATNVSMDLKVTVCYSYHNINETIIENRVYTMQATDLFLDWLRAKSCASLQAMLPPNVAPRLIYE